MGEGSGGYLMSALPRRAFQSKRSPAGESKRTREAKTAHVLFLPLVSSGGKKCFMENFGAMFQARGRENIFSTGNTNFTSSSNIFFFFKLKLLVVVDTSIRLFLSMKIKEYGQDHCEKTNLST
jgi:hypothetical protein